MAEPDGRSLALGVLDRVRKEGKLATAALRAELARWDPDPRASALANRLALGVLRERRFLDHIIDHLASRGAPVKDQRLMDILRLGIYELTALDRIPGYASVNRYVDLAKRTKSRRMGGFVNALLRSASKLTPDRLGLMRREAPLAVRLSLPDWLAGKMPGIFSEEWQTVVHRLGSPPPIALRVNPARTTRDALAAALTDMGLTPQTVDWSDLALILPPDQPPYMAVAFLQGHFWPQDLGSQLVCELAAALCPRLLLDGCAGRGTKSFALAGREIDVVAGEPEASRLAELAKREERYAMGPKAKVVLDLAAPPFAAGAFDCVLVDAPCTGLGTIRRHPELKWRRTPADVVVRAELQLRLLGGAAPLLKNQGTLMYVNCTPVLDEGPQVVESFLADNPGFALVPPPRPPGPLGKLVASLQGAAASLPWYKEGYLMTLPTVLDGDCFFMAFLDYEA